MREVVRVGKDQTIWGSMGYIFACSSGNVIENGASPSFYANSLPNSLA